MQKAKILILLVFIFGIVACQQNNQTNDNKLTGVWQAQTYIIQGKPYPMSGLMMITDKYFMANTVFNLSTSSEPDANANSGPYHVKDNKIILTQWMQLHWRPNNAQENFLNEGTIEEIPFKIEGDKLIFNFPSGNQYISKRLE